MSDMDNDKFRELWNMLDQLYSSRVDGDGLNSLHAGGMISFARCVCSELEQWQIEVARRAKAEAENARLTEEAVRGTFGEDAYDKLTPDHMYGLNFKQE